jgi:hypothetical protein
LWVFNLHTVTREVVGVFVRFRAPLQRVRVGNPVNFIGGVVKACWGKLRRDSIC